ncbi:response regulator [Rhodoplanes sp. SY1]|uniref:response regulator n=1 Tax=Rhodoplanes sp. SY1 TaxID=3166646 RepID=UPI0038B485D8
MSKKSVLAVDDGITMRLFYREVLEKAGFVVEEAANGIEGLERALMTRFDLMVVDINMPKMNGYEMVRQMRDNPALRSIPVLTVSTEEKEGDVVKAYDAGANFYLVKPVRPDDLAAAARLLTGSVA